MRRWHAERDRMLRRWRLEIAEHERSYTGFGRPGYRRYQFHMDMAPIPPVVCDDSCHCYLGPGFFRKRHPYDCGKAGCWLCHSEKLERKLSPARAHRKRAAIRYEDVASGGW